MKALVTGIALMVLAVSPSWSQTTQSQSNDQNMPRADGVSKPGVAGKPGSKSGPTVTPSGTSTPSENSTTRLQDESKVPGAPGNKSGSSTGRPADTGKGTETK